MMRMMPTIAMRDLVAARNFDSYSISALKIVGQKINEARAAVERWESAAKRKLLSTEICQFFVIFYDEFFQPPVKWPVEFRGWKYNYFIWLITLLSGFCRGRGGDCQHKRRGEPHRIKGVAPHFSLRRLIDKSLFTSMQHWSGAVMCPASHDGFSVKG
jgi:hypothetical protein